MIAEVLAAGMVALAFASLMGGIMTYGNWMRRSVPVHPNTPEQHRLVRRVKFINRVLFAIMFLAVIAMVYAGQLRAWISAT